jgi:sarcosine oxidase subunit beta
VKAKILIVGGGGMGVSIALHAATRCDPLNEPVMLIEKSSLGAGSSGRSGAIVHAAYSDRVLAGMARDSLKQYTHITTHTGRSVGYRKTGVLFLPGPGDEEKASYQADLKMQRALGIIANEVNADEMRGLVSGIEVADDAVGIWQPEGGFLDPGRTINTIAKLARARGATTRSGVAEPHVIVKNGRVTGVETDKGFIEADHVVLATGAWTRVLLGELGVEWPLQVLRTEEHFLEMPSVEANEDDDLDDAGGHETRFLPDPLESLPVAHPVLIDRGNCFYIRCDPQQGRSRVGRIGFTNLPELDTPLGRSEVATKEFSEWAREAVVQRLPAYRDLSDLGSNAAHISVTPDGRGIVGEVPSVKGLWIVTGFSGLDYTLAPSIGEGLVQMIEGRPVAAFKPEFFSPERFD